MKSRWFLAPLVCVAVAIAVVLTFSSLKKQSILALRTNMLAASQRYPKFTMAQRLAVLREWQSETHPMFRDLSAAEAARRMLAAALSASGSAPPPTANFFGNVTTINGLAGDMLGMERTSSCSLTMGSISYMLSLPSFTYTIDGPTTPNYDQVLHNEAQLTTTGGHWPAGCGDPVVGIPARKASYLGLTKGGFKVYADAFFDGTTQTNDIETVVATASDDAAVSSSLITSLPNPLAMAAADLNGDGNPDMVALSDAYQTGQTGTVSVLLGDSNGDGGFGSPTNYNLPGDSAIGAVIDDFNGDGKLDVVVTSVAIATNGTPQTDYLSFFAGKGDGTFETPQNVSLTPPSGITGTPYGSLISASLRGNGKKDVVTGQGVILFGNGDGTFTQSATLAFPSSQGTSEFGPNVVAADFNKDGKLDLAYDDGASIQIYLGNGDGTFSAAGGYATIYNVGYLTATDLDGDGNVDLYSGIASAGMFNGDQFDLAHAQALMGIGDGAFQGAPEMPFVFTGTNIMDLNKDGIPDGVGVNATTNTSNVTMTSYLGSKSGTFSSAQTFTVSPITVGSSTVSFSSLDSYGLGDVTGDGNVDLVLIGAGAYGPQGLPGFELAAGQGNGMFAAPTWIQAPSFVATGDTDYNESISGLFVADVNGDGKADLIYSYSDEDYQTGTYYQGIAVQLSTGSGNFAAPQVIQTWKSTTPPTGAAPLVVQTGHTRTNGALDLFTETSTTSGSTVTWQLQLYLGKGDGTFGPATTPPVADNITSPSFGSMVGQIALADMNGDGKPDLITLGTSATGNYGEVAISLGNGDGTFQTPNILDFGGGSSDGYGLAAADFNGDGKIDVAVTGFNPPIDTGIFLGKGDGTLESFTGAYGAVEPAEGIDLLIVGPAMTADFNGDGKPDLIAGSAVLLNLGAASTLTPTTTTLTASPTSVTSGTSVTLTATVSASTTPTGSVTFYDGTTVLGTRTLNGSGVATYSTSSLAVGTHSITASYPANSTFAGSTSTAVMVTVTGQAKIGTTSTLTASATTVSQGASVTLTDTVAPASGTGTPTGTVTFMNGPATLGTGTLNGSGVATYSTTGLLVGTNTITASYPGDTNFSGSASGSVTVTVTAVAPSFTIAASPTSASVTAGSSTITAITVKPAGGFNQQVSFTCSGLPTGGTCTFSANPVTPSGTATATTNLTIATTSQSGALTMPSRRGSGGVATLALVAAGALWFFRRKKPSPWMHMLPLLLVLVAVAAVISGCGGSGGSSGGGGGGGGSQPQTYSITVTGTAGTENQTATFSLTVS